MAGNETHPTWAQLDAVRTGEGERQDTDHVAACARCRAVIAAIEQLAADLKGAAPLPFEIPADTDARILWNARKRAQAARKDAPALRRPGAARWAIAAAVVLALGAVAVWERTGITPVQVAKAEKDDVDGNGTIDIRDAFLLAKALEPSSDADLAGLIEGEEQFDSSDVDRIARRAVALGRRG